MLSEVTCMVRKMRREKQALSQEETVRIFENGSSGVLAVSGDDGYPYAVPLSYAYADGKLYFHCATDGHKLDAVKNCEKASFCVVAQDRVVPEALTTHYVSAIAFGRMALVRDGAEKRRGLDLLIQKYCFSNRAEKNNAEIASGWDKVLVLVLEIELMTGKASIQ